MRAASAGRRAVPAAWSALLLVMASLAGLVLSSHQLAGQEFQGPPPGVETDPWPAPFPEGWRGLVVEKGGEPLGTGGASAARDVPLQRDLTGGTVEAAAPFASPMGGQEEPPQVSPGWAFLRSLVVPGWGHAAIGSYTRGGSYFLLQGTTLWMLYKSAEKRASARSERDLHFSLAEARARAEGIQDPDSIRLEAEADERVQEFEELVETRGEQVEDWAALGIFFLLMGAADAFVSAHLQDFPEPLDVEVVPWSSSGASPHGGQGGLWRSLGVDIGIRIPVGGGAGRSGLP